MVYKKKIEDSDDGSDFFVDVDSDTSDVVNDVDKPKELVAKETSAQKRRRLARSYLEEIKLEDQVEVSKPEQETNALIEDKLRDERLRAAGKILNIYSEKISVVNILDRLVVFRTNKEYKHRKPITSVEFASPSRIKGKSRDPTQRSSSDKYSAFLFTGSKDGSVIKWDFYSGKVLMRYENTRTRTPKSLKEEVLCISSSSDGAFLAVGRRSRVIDIWSIDEDKYLGTLKHHKGAITGLVFRTNTHTLFSCSSDQTVVIWDLDTMSYIEKLFGHEDAISSIDSLTSDRCLTSGSRDRTIRYWKIPEETQLIFRAKEIAGSSVVSSDGSNTTIRLGSLESVSFIDDDTFVSGSDVGSISLWSIKKKKPIFTRDFCHELVGQTRSPNGIGIVSLTALHRSDIFASGACLGTIKIWKVAPKKLSFEELLAIPMIGFINSLRFFEVKNSQSGRNQNQLYLTAAVGKDHRSGRWTNSIRDAKNSIIIVKLT